MGFAGGGRAFGLRFMTTRINAFIDANEKVQSIVRITSVNDVTFYKRNG